MHLSLLYYDQFQISSEAKKGGKLLSVMVKNDEKDEVPQMNGTKQESGNTENGTEETDEKTQKSDSNLTLRMVFYLNFEEDPTPTHIYTVLHHRTPCTGIKF